MSDTTKNSNIVLQSEDYINQLAATGQLELFSGYSASNACKAAYIMLSRQVINGTSLKVLETCTQASILQSLLDMVIKGLNPSKRQLDFIPYKKEITVLKEGKEVKQTIYELSCQLRASGYFSMAQRYGLDVEKFNCIPVHVKEKDSFSFGVNLDTGAIELKKHDIKSDLFISKIDDLYGMYATYFVNGVKKFKFLHIEEIKKRWKNSKDSNWKMHNEYPVEMAERTMISHICTRIADRTNELEHEHDHVIEDADPQVVFEPIENQKQIPAQSSAQTVTQANPQPEPEKATKKAEKQTQILFGDEPGF